MASLVKLLKENDQTFNIIFDEFFGTSIEVTNTTEGIYKVIRTMLKEEAVKGEGLCGGGFEVYTMKNGWKFIVVWVDKNLTKIYLGQMGVAF